jgi:hypothetical protein
VLIGAALLLASSIGLSARAATPDVVDGELVGAFDVLVGTTLYDVVFQDGTCVDLFDGCDDSADFVFQTSGAANQASLALLGQVLLGTYDDMPELTAGCENLNVCYVTTPYGPSVPSGGDNFFPASVAQNESDTGTDRTNFFSIWDMDPMGTRWVFAIWTEVPECSNGTDDDGDGAIDHPGDPDCLSPEDVSEEPDCDDLVDNDLDGFIDYPDDPGCASLSAQVESPACQDGLDNDNDGLTDFDGGQSVHGACAGGVCPPGVSDPDGDGVADPDSYCVAATTNREKPNGTGGCGLGPELALLLPGLAWLRRKRGGA